MPACLGVDRQGVGETKWSSRTFAGAAFLTPVDFATPALMQSLAPAFLTDASKQVPPGHSECSSALIPLGIWGLGSANGEDV